ncbi:hypothetical protein FSP39_006426 [Pinctada imbricata]|uniref:FACT complex subunit SSRP1 n=1 Tax=Pinctada imbricata TaxID=66713 RepID=A0AA88XEU5_PINIB|nr:hypothetical protein FSP39_006426 [Pinctada imbricata]
MGDFQEFGDVVQEVRGALNPGRLKLQSNNIMFKNLKTGKVDQYPGTDVDKAQWLKRARGYCLKFVLNSGTIHRYDGFKDTEFEKLAAFISKFYMVSLEKRDISVKGWNWGMAQFTGNGLEFDVDNKLAFEVPLNFVSHTTTSKQEVTLEFHPNDDAAVSLTELRFHIPPDPKDQEKDPVNEFYENVLDKADIIQATGDALAVFTEVQCLTPRGRYDFKIYQTFLQLHGKTFDYKIPYTTVLRLFLLPHKDQRQMFFVISLDPPIKQGQTRYHFCILLFNKDDEMTLELGLSEEDLEKKYEGKLQKEMNGPEYEIISRVFKAVTNRKITVPGSFVGNTGNKSISCSYKAATGFLYPLERGFIFVHKPPMHIRFDEVSQVNFARSAGTNRSFDFEVETRSGTSYTFVGIEKDEYGKLYDFVSSKKLSVKNIGGPKKSNYTDDIVDSDDEQDTHDAYLERMKAEGKDRFSGDEDDDSDSSDVSYDPDAAEASDVAEEYDSNPPTSSDSSDSEYSGSNDDEESDDGSGTDAEERRIKRKKEKEEKKKKKKSKSAKTVPEKLPGSSKKKEKKKKKKEKKDPNAPKRPQTAYFLWFNSHREEIKTENPGLSITELSKKAGEMWRDLGDEDKKQWNEKAAEAKVEYEKAMEEYLANKKESDSEDEEETGTSEKKKKKKSPGKSPKKSVSDSRAGAGANYKSKEFIESSGSASSGLDSDDEPLKKKVKKESKRRRNKNDDDDDKSSSVGELPEDEEILSSPEHSGKSGEESD